MLIIFKVGKIVFATENVLASCCWIFGIELLNYVYTYTTQGNFTNRGAVLLASVIVVVLVELVSEQVTALMFTDIDRD